MNVSASQATPQAFGSLSAPSTPSAQLRQPQGTESVERPAPNATQRLDAAPRAEAPARPEADARPSTNLENGRPGSRLDIVV